MNTVLGKQGTKNEPENNRGECNIHNVENGCSIPFPRYDSGHWMDAIENNIERVMQAHRARSSMASSLPLVTHTFQQVCQSRSRRSLPCNPELVTPACLASVYPSYEQCQREIGSSASFGNWILFKIRSFVYRLLYLELLQLFPYGATYL